MTTNAHGERARLSDEEWIRVLEQENDRLCAELEVRDNGKGMEGSTDLMEQTARGHYGLAGMQERADTVNGELKLVSAQGKGTTLIVSIPLEQDGAAPRRKAYCCWG